MSFGSVSGPSWDSAYLIGGGPSLKGFPLERLRGRTVVAINDALLHAPWATAVISVDINWIKNRKKELLEFKGEKYLVVRENTPHEVPEAVYLRHKTDRGFSESPDILHVRGNSGYAALNLAYLKRAKEIYLLGYDFTRPREHWFENYPWSHPRENDSSTPKMYQNWADEFVYTLPQLHGSSVNVINIGLSSLVSAFPRVSLESFKESLKEEITK